MVTTTFQEECPFERPLFGDGLVGPARLMHEHRAGKDNLLDLDMPQGAQQPLGAATVTDSYFGWARP